MARGRSTHSCHRVRDGAADHQRERSLRAAQRPAGTRPGRRPDAGPGADPATGRAAAGCDAARRLRAGIEARAGDPGSRARPARPPADCTATSTSSPTRARRAASRSGGTSTRTAASARSTTPRSLFPVNALKLDGTSQGVAVLDMSDPAHPMQTATLTELPMLSPHESLNLNAKRGLLAAVLGNPSTNAGAGVDLRRPRGLPAPGAAVDARWSPGSATRAASRPTARRSGPPAPRCSRSPRST